MIEQDYWKKKQTICGIDEVGRGCLAGPIVAVALILKPNMKHPDIKDSKLLNSIQMENIFSWITDNSWYAFGISNARTIDKHNIYRTTQTTMKKALINLLHKISFQPDTILIDAMPLLLSKTSFASISIESLIKGESKSASIAAASIVAKVIRDRIIKNIDSAFPAYELKNNKGYGTNFHIKSLKTHRASVLHRKTFIKNFTEEEKFNDEKKKQQQLFC